MNVNLKPKIDTIPRFLMFKFFIVYLSDENNIILSLKGEKQNVERIRRENGKTR